CKIMKLIIAEKPSVGRDLAAFFKCTEDKKGYFEGNGYAVTWAFGHLVSLAQPEEYGFKEWTTESIPFIPEKFRLVINESAKSQFNIVGNLIKNCAEIIVATDAGREGELIFRHIYNYVGVRKPFKRLWLSSLTNEAINEAFKSMKDGSHYDNLYYSAISRQESDWLIGMNLTRMVTLSAGDRKKMVSIGRVQTPTLAIKLSHTNIEFLAKYETSFKTPEQAKSILGHVGSQINCSKVNKSKKIDKSPTLFDLTTLQRVAEKKFGYSAAQTLEYAQKLYEMKLTTYPRTDSSYLSQDMTTMVSDVIKTVASQNVFPIANGQHHEKIKLLSVENNKVFDNSKVTDHHAIIPTGMDAAAVMIFTMW
nr:DNA topoisomerase [Cyclobacteriaceae bacterium]